jgi:tyrosyl-tRNA synthetase
MDDLNQALDLWLSRGVAAILPDAGALKAKLLKEKIKVYTGVDPTGASLHIGHLIPLRKLAGLQKMGHQIIFLIGDFTAMIGDPTDKLATRKQLTREEVLANCAGYKDQLRGLIDFEGPNAAQLLFNSEWLSKLTFADVVELSAHFTVQQMMERDMFEKRWQAEKPIGLHEFMYPLMQGYDSVAMGVDLEIGGNDQTFNMLAGRALLKDYAGREKFVMTTKLLADESGKKMGKTEGNMIALSDSPEDMYGKIMGWTDGMILPGFELLTDVSPADLENMRQAMLSGENPMAFKKKLALSLVESLRGAEAGQKAADYFTRVHGAGQLPEEIEVLKVPAGASIIEVLVASGAVLSKNDARRQVEQSAVKVDSQTVTDSAFVPKSGQVIQKGKHFFVRLA